MRIITRKRLNDYIKKHPECESALNHWYHILSNTEYASFKALRKTFPGADRVKNLTIFNIGGNKARLIAAIHYNTKCVYVRHILTHSEYDKGMWKKDLK